MEADIKDRVIKSFFFHIENRESAQTMKNYVLAGADSLYSAVKVRISLYDPTYGG